ncbi:MAG TPA: pantoate--beta-alanine ligase [Prolixibacteraceae bacterium]
MELFRKINELKSVLDADRQNGLSIGLVPTMGALHRGHLSLVDRAAEENDRVVVSIFVNPTQFNDPNDLKNYPRNLDKDLMLLSTRSCDYIFSPNVEEMYPEPDTRKFDFGSLETVMEGKFRPGHFNGVAQVMSKLFAVVEPHKAYFGRKDFQQYSILKNMVNRMKLPVQLVPCDTVREADGLAMSSRNALLSKEHRMVAPRIYQILKEAQREAGNLSPEDVRRHVIEKTNSVSLLRLEYFEIVDELTLQEVSSWKEEGVKVGCIAVFAGSVRLIDNIVFEK